LNISFNSFKLFSNSYSLYTVEMILKSVLELLICCCRKKVSFSFEGFSADCGSCDQAGGGLRPDPANPLHIFFSVKTALHAEGYNIWRKSSLSIWLFPATIMPSTNLPYACLSSPKTPTSRG